MPTVLRIGRFRFYFFSNEGEEPPHIHIKAAEDQAKFWLDPIVLATAREELGFSEGDRIRVVLGDARLSIGPLTDGAFDLVVGDAFGGLSVPWHLTTREFVAEIERVLRPGGRYVMNLIDGDALRFARATSGGPELRGFDSLTSPRLNVWTLISEVRTQFAGYRCIRSVA